MEGREPLLRSGTTELQVAPAEGEQQSRNQVACRDTRLNHVCLGAGTFINEWPCGDSGSTTQYCSDAGCTTQYCGDVGSTTQYCGDAGSTAWMCAPRQGAVLRGCARQGKMTHVRSIR